MYLDSRPILSIDIVRLSDCFILVCVGTTAGDVNLWVLSQGNDGEVHSPQSPILTFQGHTMGANSISAVIVSDECLDGVQRVQVVVSSGGDDQALSLRLFCISLPQSDETKEVSIETLASSIKKEACASAIKGTNIVGDSISGFRIYTTGYDQRLAMWEIFIKTDDLNKYTMGLSLLSSTPIDVKDINTLGGCVAHKESNGTTKEYVVAGGEGLEVLSFERNIWHAALALRNCNKLLITCGAGFSADSGLATYETMPEEYKELCNPIRLVDSLNKFQQFWLKFAKEYESISPHLGYSILENFCDGRKLIKLQQDGKNKSKSISPWWIYSSNVDGHFGLFDCFKDTVCEIHGRATEFRCAHYAGYSNGVKRSGQAWDKWNNACLEFISNKVCKTAKLHITAANSNDSSLNCTECHIPLRPNVLMFHDTDENILKDISDSRQRYQEWEAQVEEKVVMNGEHLVILELGAGENVTAVRDESEEVFNDVLKRLQENESSCGSVTLIRVNPKDSSIKKKVRENPDSNFISIPLKAEHALLSINQALGDIEPN